MVSLASLAGERMFFEGDSSSGVSGDLEGATRIAVAMEGYWGMGSTVASHGVTHEVGIGGGGRPGEKKGKDEQDLLESSLGGRIETKLGELLKRTEKLLMENRKQILALAMALETNKTLPGEDVMAVIQGRQGPLVDGRPFYEPEFVQAAEAYHEAAVSAHKRHAGMEMTLPALPAMAPDAHGNGQSPEPIEASGDGQAREEQEGSPQADGRPSGNGAGGEDGEPGQEVPAGGEPPGSVGGKAGERHP